MAATKKQPYIFLSTSNVTSTQHSPQKGDKDKSVLVNEPQTIDE